MTNLIPASTQDAPISEMTTQEFLGLLREKQIEVHANEGRLKVSAPAGALDMSVKAQLKDRKAALLKVLRETTVGAEASQIVPLSAAELSAGIPLTPAQQGIWLVDHFNPGNVSYNIPEAFRFEQTIALETMQLAVDCLLRRHSILRTSFHEDDGTLHQLIDDAVEARVGFTDLGALPEEERERRCRDLIRAEGRRPFDLQHAPLVRFHLFRLAERRNVVFFNIHHIVSDRVSLYVLRTELIASCAAVQSGREALLPAIKFQFVDYAAWVATQMQSDAIGMQIAYWKKKLAGLPEFMDLPHSRAFPEKRSSWGATKKVFVSTTARSALNRIGTEDGVSPFMTFLAVFAVSVARWSQIKGQGAVDFCIGSPITQRNGEATEHMIGMFVNMLAFRCRVEPGMGFRDVLRQVRCTALEAYENSDVPFQSLVRAINPDRRSQRSPIFQVMFGYETYMPPVADEFQMDADAGTARYDLALHLSETAHEGLTGVIEYSTDLFEEADIDTLAAHGDVLLNDITFDPDHDVFDSPVRGPQQQTKTVCVGEQKADSASSSATSISHRKIWGVGRLTRLFSRFR
jgi:hypothetical protein